MTRSSKREGAYMPVICILSCQVKGLWKQKTGMQSFIFILLCFFESSSSDTLYAHSHFYDLDLDAVTVGQQRHKSQRCMVSATKQAISIILPTTVGLFFLMWPWPWLCKCLYIACPAWFFLSLFVSSSSEYTCEQVQQLDSFFICPWLFTLLNVNHTVPLV